MIQDLTLEYLKMHIVAELLTIKHEELRGNPKHLSCQEFRTFWPFYKKQINAYYLADEGAGMIHAIEKYIADDDFMSSFYGSWETFATDMSKNEPHTMTHITLCMKLIMARAMKYADDIDLRAAISRMNQRLN